MANNFIFTKDNDKNKKIWSAFKVALKAWKTQGVDFKVTIDVVRKN